MAYENYNSLSELFLRQKIKFRDREFLRFKRGGKWVSLSWNETFDAARDFGIGLYSLGIRKEDKVCILSENRPEWTICDYGIKSICAITVPIHTTSSPEQVGYYIDRSDTKVAIVSNEDLLKKVLKNGDVVKKLTAIVLLDSKGLETGEKILKFEDLVEIGRKNQDISKQIKQFEASSGSDIASILFTSGTTGEPRGVMLTHDNFLSNVIADNEYIPFGEDAVYFSVLPMSHVLEITCGHYKPLYEGGTIAFSSGINNLAEEFKEVKPNTIPLVPRILEKVYSGILEAVQGESFLKRRIFFWAIDVGRKASRKISPDIKLSFWLRLKRLFADLLVLRRIRKRFGGRIVLFFTGGAPIPLKVAQFFEAIGIVVLHGYGLTETSPGVSCTSTWDYKLGTAGKVVNGMEVKIAGDGEILVKGPGVMKGYYKDEEATRAAIDSSGWFHTGDIGKFDEEGYLIITDRKKDIIVLSTGKKVAPQLIESLLRMDPFIEQAVVFGEGRSYIVALIAPDLDQLLRYVRDDGHGISDVKELLNSDLAGELIFERVEEINSRLAKHEKVRRITLIPTSLTENAGELTPSLKVKRKVVGEKYGHLVDAMYYN